MAWEAIEEQEFARSGGLGMQESQTAPDLPPVHRNDEECGLLGTKDSGLRVWVWGLESLGFWEDPQYLASNSLRGG